MDKCLIVEKINDILQELIDVRLAVDEDLKSNGLDSLSLVTLIVTIEDEFGFSFNDDDLSPDKLLTINDIAILTEKYL